MFGGGANPSGSGWAPAFARVTEMKRSIDGFPEFTGGLEFDRPIGIELRQLISVARPCSRAAQNCQPDDRTVAGRWG
jgi:hypothetical protein